MTAPTTSTAGAARTLFVLLDIDNNLYNYADTGFGDEMHDRIFEYVEKKLGFSAEQAAAKSTEYYHDYGLSLHGYVKDYHIDAKEYSDFVHQCTYSNVKYNAPLVAMLRHLQFRDPAAVSSSTTTSSTADPAVAPDAGNGGPHHLFFFTNANRPHARKVLTALGIKDIFTRPRPAGSPINENHRAYDTDGFDEAEQWLGFSYEDQWRLTAPHNANKPMREAYEAIYAEMDAWIALDEQLVADHHGAQDGPAAVASPLSSVETAHRREHLRPESVVMVDDSLMNLIAPLELGWRAVWFAHDGQQLPAATNAEKKGPLLAKALSEGRLKVIRDLLELEGAIDELAH